MTRAKTRLLISWRLKRHRVVEWSRDHVEFDTYDTKPSRFIGDIPGDMVLTIDSTDKQVKGQKKDRQAGKRAKERRRRR